MEPQINPREAARQQAEDAVEEARQAVRDTETMGDRIAAVSRLFTAKRAAERAAKES
ncbi:hypothetical protein ABZ547_38660 [Streptomyces sparsogenes]|uniref:hypothetical protein n=1 Tax=Streptomyces sparsogenes TaxID=67365 RepID=UPI0033CE55B5